MQLGQEMNLPITATFPEEQKYVGEVYAFSWKRFNLICSKDSFSGHESPPSGYPSKKSIFPPVI